MERLRSALAFTSTQLSKLTVSQRMLIATLVVMLVMTLFVVRQYTATPDLEPLVSGATAEELAEVESFLMSAGVTYEVEGSQVMVEPSRRRVLQARLTSAGKMPADNTMYFNDVIDKQSWTRSTLQTHQMNNIARQNELSLIISNMSGITRASVIMDIPMRRGLGRADRTPTASVTVFPIGASGIDQDTVDAVANLVASSAAGLKVEHVRVIDGGTNRQFKARSDTDFTASSYNEHVAKTEKYIREKLLEMVGYIDGVIVTVHAQVDVTSEVTTRNAKLNEDEGSVRLKLNESGTESSQSETRQGGQPGARSNLQASIEGGGGTGSSFEESDADTSWSTHVGSEVVTRQDPRGHALQVNAVVNIPRSYFVRIFEEQGGASAGDEGDAAEAEAAANTNGPTDEQLAPIRDAEIARIQREVQSVVDMSAKTNGTKGEVLVSMVPLVPEALAANGIGGGGGVFGAAGPGGLMASNLVKTVLMSLLALVALGMVVFTTLRANRREPLPSAEEIVGIPPALDDHSAILGEAVEADSALPGIELSDDELAVRKMREQISSLVAEKPKRAATLVGHWVGDHD